MIRQGNCCSRGDNRKALFPEWYNILLLLAVLCEKAEAGLFPGTNSVIVTVAGASFSGRRLGLAGGGVRGQSHNRYPVHQSHPHKRAKSRKTRTISSTLIGLTRDSIFQGKEPGQPTIGREHGVMVCPERTGISSSPLLTLLRISALQTCKTPRSPPSSTLAGVLLSRRYAPGIPGCPISTRPGPGGGGARSSHIPGR